jgi:hypothetical protein
MNETRKDYDTFVDELMSIAILESSKTDLTIDNINKVIFGFIKLGHEFGLSKEEIIDFFGVSSDSVVHRLKYDNGDDVNFISHIFDRHLEAFYNAL